MSTSTTAAGSGWGRWKWRMPVWCVWGVVWRWNWWTPNLDTVWSVWTVASLFMWTAFSPSSSRVFLYLCEMSKIMHMYVTTEVLNFYSQPQNPYWGRDMEWGVDTKLWPHTGGIYKYSCQFPHYAPIFPGRGRVGLAIGRCIMMLMCSSLCSGGGSCAFHRGGRTASECSEGLAC